MSIRVEHIHKIYGRQHALDDVSFEINAGEIIGFLGPNGAGKSTMMKILTCYLPQSSGKAYVCGLDVEESSLEVRKLIGYLPEHNPLYLDMYVKEYLEFIAGLHKLNNKKERVKQMVNAVGLEVEQNKKIGALSKGYRQRVGLAQALIHDPKVLILDEPTTGLDPVQLVEIRELIKKTGKEKTVMLSTHIMQEVEAVCDRVIIINKGKIVANDETELLQKNLSSQSVLLVEFDQEINHHELKKINGVSDVILKGNNTFQIISPADTDLRKAIFDFAVQKKISVLSMQKEERSMEDVFKEYTRK